jgi:hypothetical protein
MPTADSCSENDNSELRLSLFVDRGVATSRKQQKKKKLLEIVHVQQYLDFRRFEFRRFELSSVFNYNYVSKFRRLLRSFVAFRHHRAILFLSSFSLRI